MKFELWAALYPPLKGHIPTHEQLATMEVYTDYEEAVSQMDWLESFHEIGGLLVVECEAHFYIVYGPDYAHGYQTAA